MNTIRILQAFAVSFIVMMAFVATPERAWAQEQNLQCCTYFIDIIGVDPPCFPIRIKTQWEGGAADEPVYAANGSYYRNVPGPCPRARKIQWASVDMGSTQVHLGETKTVVVGGCCYKVTVGLNPNYCISITVRKC